MERFKRILFFADRLDPNSPSLKRAVSLAEHSQAELTFFDVLPRLHQGRLLPEGRMSQDELEKMIIRHRVEELEGLIAGLAGGIDIKIRVVMGPIFVEIIREVIRGAFDLVVKCIEPMSGFYSLFFGSTDMNLLRKCPCPVWLIRPDGPARYRRIMAAVDISPADDEDGQEGLNLHILDMAASLALSEGCDLHLVHAWQVFGESLLRASRAQMEEGGLDTWLAEQRLAIEERQKRFAGRLPEMLGEKTMAYLQPQVHLIQGEPQVVIPDFARKNDIDLVVMGTVGRTGLPGFFMGNTAENILSQLECSVLALKPAGFTTPITLDS